MTVENIRRKQLGNETVLKGKEGKEVRLTQS
jgi:hypothetical protein